MTKNYDLAYWDSAKLADAVAHARTLGALESIVMGAYDYADVRKFGRESMDVSVPSVAPTHPSHPSAHHLGSIYGVHVYVFKGAIKGVIGLFGAGGSPLSHVVNPRRWAEDGPSLRDHGLLFHHAGFPACREHSCLALSVMGS